MFLTLITYDSKVKQKINLPNFSSFFLSLNPLFIEDWFLAKFGYEQTGSIGQDFSLKLLNNLKLPCSREPTTPAVTSGGKQSVFALSTVAEVAPQ